MSLLEDIFLRDEANEARELERVIEGDDYDERRRSLSSGDESNNDNQDDEAEEDKRRVDPSSTKIKKVAKNPRFILNPARLTGPRGIQVIPEHFKDFKFKGKGHEKEDLDMILKKLEHWAYRLYPKFAFQDCLKKIETLGKKRPVMVHLHKIRTDQFLSEDTVVQKDSSDDEAQPPQEEDEFDKLLQQQIDLARATPTPGSIKKHMRNDNWERVVETPMRDERSVMLMPKATSSPSISEEQKQRMLRNRKLAEEKRLARLKQATNINNSNNTIVEVDENNKNQSNTTVVKVDNKKDQYNSFERNYSEVIPKKVNKSNVIESSDSEDECNVIAVNESVVVDIHNTNIDKDGLDGIDKGSHDKNVHIESVNIEHKYDNEANNYACTVKNNEDNIHLANKNQDVNEDNVAKASDEIISVEETDGCYNVEAATTSAYHLINDQCEPNVNNDKDENEMLIDTNVIEEKGTESINLENTPISDKPQNILQEETVEHIVEDVMDVDFSDDF